MTRIPGGIKDDNTIGSDKIDSETSGSGGHQEQFDGGVVVEVVDQPFPLQSRRAAIKTVVGYSRYPGFLNIINYLSVLVKIFFQTSAFVNFFCFMKSSMRFRVKSD